MTSTPADVAAALASVDQAAGRSARLLVATVHRMIAYGRGGPAIVYYAAMAARRAGDAHVMCEVLGCDPSRRAVHVAAFDWTDGHRDAMAAARCRTWPRSWRDGT